MNDYVIYCFLTINCCVFEFVVIKGECGESDSIKQGLYNEHIVYP